MAVRIIRRGRGGRAKAVRPQKGRVAGVNKRIRSYVKSAVKAQAETKYVANSYSDDTHPSLTSWDAPVNLTGAVAGKYRPALPVVSQGTGDYQRVGAKIMPTACFTDLTLGYKAKDLSCSEVVAVIYYGTCKAGRTWQSTTPIQSATDLLDDGDGTTSAFGGSKNDLLQPINKHMYNAKRMLVHLGKSTGVLNARQNAGLAEGALATSFGSSFKTVRLNFKPPKALQYDQTAHNWPSNYAPWFAVSFCRVDELDTDPILDAGTLTVSSLSHMYFKDV